MMVIKSIHDPTLGSDSRKMPTSRAMPLHRATAAFLESLNRVCHDSLTASNILIRLVMPAKATDRKNITAKSLPMGICRNMPGRVMNIRGGPALGSMPNANTAGIMARAAIMAATVSKNAVRMDAFGISSDLAR